MKREGSSGRIVVLNGGSSAGKTTLGRKLQTSLAGSWLLVGVDLFLWMLPAELIGDPTGLTLDDGAIHVGPEFRRLYAAFQAAVAALARSGVDVIVDEVLLDGEPGQRRWAVALEGVDTYWIGVRCAPDIAAAREAERGDRPAGTAAHQALSVHERVRYDIEVDTGALDLASSVDLIAAGLRDRWSVPSTGASLEPPVLPPTSAFGADGSVQPAPWER